MKQQLKLSRVVTAFLLVTEFLSCKSPSGSDSGYDLNGCSEYGCPLHPDKMFVNPEKCPECGLQMINKNSMDSLLARIKWSSMDSLKLYHRLVIEQNNEIMMNDSMSKAEKINLLMEASKNLEKARMVNENLDSLLFGKRILLFKPQYRKQARLYAAASYHITNISNELTREKYDRGKIRLYSGELKEIMIELDRQVLPKHH